MAPAVTAHSYNAQAAQAGVENCKPTRQSPACSTRQANLHIHAACAAAPANTEALVSGIASSAHQAYGMALECVQVTISAAAPHRASMPLAKRGSAVVAVKPWFHTSNSTAYFWMSASGQASCIAWFTCAATKGT